jgi:hypothetical protein
LVERHQNSKIYKNHTTSHHLKKPQNKKKMVSNWIRSGGIDGNLQAMNLIAWIILPPVAFIGFKLADYFNEKKEKRKAEEAEFHRLNGIPDPLPTWADVDYAIWRGYFDEARQMKERIRMAQMTPAPSTTPSTTPSATPSATPSSS